MSDQTPPKVIRLQLPEIIDRKPDIRKFSVAELESILVELGEKPFRAKQIHEWIWKKGAKDIQSMSNLSKALRDLLDEKYEIRNLKVVDEQVSTDGTVKCGFELYDGNVVEGVLIPVAADQRMTACISSQVGCSLSCKFCATGYMDKKRNLEPSEIYDQVLAIHGLAMKHFNMPLTNIVFMGMGEPLLNIRNVLAGIDRITAPDGLNMSPRRITVSTAGIAKMIDYLSEQKVKFNLALSLHAANDEKRNQIMPINDSNTLAVLGASLKRFFNETHNKITLEYILFNKFNDNQKDADELLKFSRQFPCKVNIIEYNPIAEASFERATDDRLGKFVRYLTSKGLIATVRRSRGKDIDAACGQLANKKSKD